LTDFQFFDVEDFVCNDSFQSYCRGQKPSDILWWEGWIRKHPEKEPVIAEARRLFDILSARQGRRSEQLALLRDGIERQVSLKELLLEKSVPAPVKRSPVRWYAYAAAALVLIAAGTVGVFKLNRKPAPYLQAYEYATSAHQHKTIILPDGSIVLLNENSHLSIGREFDPFHRTISVSGGAYLNIRHDAAHPFTVQTPQYKIRVLGTVFYVNAYPGERTQETGLISGKVEIVTDPSKHIVLKPNEKFVLASGNAGSKEKILENKAGRVVALDTDSLTECPVGMAWTRNKIEIHNESFVRIGQKLEACYGLKIIFADDVVKGYHYTATFDGETILNVLQSMQLSYPFNYSVGENSIVISTR
jgi:transmembrane sensor